MKYKLFCMVFVFVLLFSFAVHAIGFQPEEIYRSVVVVYTKAGVGSGFSIRENIILTNAHVVEKSKTVMVTMYDGTTLDGKVIKTDVDQDLALIEIDTPLPLLAANKTDVSIGQEVYAIGAPQDMPYTMTKGIISALERKLGSNTYIQVDASVNSGNSGGPLIDEMGNVIGMITLKASDAEGIGFAIPTAQMLAFADGAAQSSADALDVSQMQDGYGRENMDSTFLQVKKENEILKMTVIVLSVLLALSVLLILKLCVKKTKKDEFDFEIEIEE